VPVSNDPFTIDGLRAQFAAGSLTVRALVDDVFQRVEAQDADPATWIYKFPRDEVLSRADVLDAMTDGWASLPLFGVPFAVKDNVDVAGVPTTAGCPGYAYTPEANAAAVQRLLNAGAILIGKTNLDQFATGLVGTRSPHGAPRCVFNRDYISGGSSSGSAVAVAAGLVAFALGTDTAGSGRVPAAFNNIVGLKPTRGRVSNRGIVPACRSLDCVSIFAHTVADARTVLEVIEGYDPEDPYSRTKPAFASKRSWNALSSGLTPAPNANVEGRGGGFSFGLPEPKQLRFFGDKQAEALFQSAIERLSLLGGTPKKIDYQPFGAVAEMLYDGPWVVEREALLAEHQEVDPEHQRHQPDPYLCADLQVQHPRVRATFAVAPVLHAAPGANEG
jgi:allophanate hydrolase